MGVDKTLPELVTCKVTYDCKPLEGVYLRAILETDYRNNYDSIIGPTNKEGMAYLDQRQVLEDAARNLDMGLQDYFPIEKCFTGKIFLSILNIQQLEGVLSAYELYKDYIEYPVDYQKNIQMSINKLSEINWSKLKLAVQVVPKSINIRVENRG